MAELAIGISWKRELLSHSRLKRSRSGGKSALDAASGQQFEWLHIGRQPSSTLQASELELEPLESLESLEADGLGQAVQQAFFFGGAYLRPQVDLQRRQSLGLAKRPTQLPTTSGTNWQ